MTHITRQLIVYQEFDTDIYLTSMRSVAIMGDTQLNAKYFISKIGQYTLGALLSNLDCLAFHSCSLETHRSCFHHMASLKLLCSTVKFMFLVINIPYSMSKYACNYHLKSCNHHWHIRLWISSCFITESET